jgi:hypothetical protein
VYLELAERPKALLTIHQPCRRNWVESLAGIYFGSLQICVLTGRLPRRVSCPPPPPPPPTPQSDSCRALQLRCHTAREGHLFRKFGWGNQKSLVEQPAAAGVDVRQELLRFYK